MSSKKIFIVRHGETDYNNKGVLQGRSIDSSLNEKGRRQSEAFWEAYKHIKFDKIYTSSLLRSQQSVAKFIEIQPNWSVCSGLDEISWGDFEGKDLSIYPDYPQLSKAWCSGQTHLPVQGGESPQEVSDRQMEVIEQLIKSPEEQILICMHGKALRILLSKLLDDDISKMDNYEYTNLGLYVLGFEHQAFKLISANLTSHLEAISSSQKPIRCHLGR